VWLRFHRTGWPPAVCTHACACVLLQLARFGQVITNRVNVWFWNAALNRLSTLNRLTRFRTLLRFYFLGHLKPSKSCLRWRLQVTSHLGAYVLIAKAHQAITPRRPAAQSCRCARVYITHQRIRNHFRSVISFGARNIERAKVIIQGGRGGFGCQVVSVPSSGAFGGKRQ
jgi:hypothetical protein